MAREPDDSGIAHINQYGDANFKGVLKCTWSEHKGRIVHATRSFQIGEVILIESPLHVVQEQEASPAFKKLEQLCEQQSEDLDYYAPLWCWCAIQSLTKDQLKYAKLEGCTGTSPEIQHKLLLLHHEEVQEPSSAARTLEREFAPGVDPVLIERLIQVWLLNCFQFSEDPQGYATYFFSSMKSHSCFPNAVWSYTDGDQVLRARREINVGDEVCISYLPESGLLLSTPSRRMELNVTKHFWCTCERCANGLQDKSRGLVCPSCHKGAVFAKTPEAGPANDGSLLSSQLEDMECGSCNHKTTKAEAAKLAGFEATLQELVDNYTADESSGPPVKQLQNDEEFIAKHFAQHVLADLAWEQHAMFYVAKRRTVDQRRLLELRQDFHAQAYPGLSEAHAWVLEALGNCILSIGKAAPDSDSEAEERQMTQNKEGQLSAKDAPAAAQKHLTACLDIRKLMFG